MANLEHKEVTLVVTTRNAFIRVKFNRLLARLELETGNRPTQREVAEEAGIAESTLSRFVQGKTGRYDSDVLIKLVDYFDERLKDGCTLADLIEYPPARSQDTVDAVPVAA